MPFKDDMEDKSKLYWNPDKLFSFPFLLGFVIGERGVGKSFSTKLHVMKKYLKTGEQFIYMRRYKTELDSALTTFFSDLQANGYFLDHELKVKKSKMITLFLCDNKVCGYAIPLSTANILKSTSFPDVSTIIFDEFMLDNAGTYRYLKNEVTLTLDVFETVFRLREGRIVFLGNATSIYANPYFAYFDIDLPYNSEYKSYREGAIVVNYIKNLNYREEKKKTKFGKLIDGTDYGRYAIDNESLRDNPTFIAKRPPNSSFYGVMVINGMYLGIWSGNDGYLYLSEKFDPNTIHKFVFDYNDHTEQTIFADVRHNIYLHMCIRGYKQGWLRFENQKIKANAVHLLNRCISF